MGLRPGNFKGTQGEDPEKFIRKFERLAAYGEWDDNKKLTVFPLLLDDKADDFYESSPDQTKQNYQLLRTAFITHFQPNKSKLVRWNELCQKSLTIGQSIAEYHDELKKEAAKIGGVTDEQLMIVFLNGLPTDIKEHVALQEPVSLAEALDKARLYESIKSERKGKKEIIRSLAIGKNAVDSNKNNLDELTLAKNEIAQIKDELMALRLQNDELRKSGQAMGYQNVQKDIYLPPQKRKPNPNPPTQWNPNKETRTCFYCNIKGHLKQDCYKFRRENPQRSQNQQNSRQLQPAKTTKFIYNQEVFIKLNPDMTFQGKLNGVNARYLIDSGSELSICSETFFEKLHPKPRLYASVYRGVVGVDGEETELTGTITATVNLGEFRAKFQLEVLQGMRYDAILGRDFLNNYVSKIDWPDCRLVFKNGLDLANAQSADKKEEQKITNKNTGSEQKTAGKLTRQLTLAPGQTKTIMVYPNGNVLSNWVAVSKLNKIELPVHLEVEPKMESGLKGEIPCTLTNKSNRVPISLRSNTSVCEIRPIKMLKSSVTIPIGTPSVSSLPAMEKSGTPSVTTVPTVGPKKERRRRKKKGRRKEEKGSHFGSEAGLGDPSPSSLSPRSIYASFPRFPPLDYLPGLRRPRRLQIPRSLARAYATSMACPTRNHELRKGTS